MEVKEKNKKASTPTHNALITGRILNPDKGTGITTQRAAAHALYKNFNGCALSGQA